MASLGFKVFKTKKLGGKKKYNLENPADRKSYFQFKAGKEIADIRDYLRKNTFVAFMMGKKNSGKGTYTKLFAEQIGPERVKHISVGDVVRDAHREIENPKTKKALVGWLKENYRGLMPLSKAIDALVGRTTSTLVPTELILALVERAISLDGKKKAVFIDGFPRGLDQISYSLFFRHIMGYRDDPDFFVFIDVPTSIIAARLAGRVICPVCHVPRHPKLMRTKEIGYDKGKKEFYLKCDNASCNDARMIPKEGDNLGMAAIKDRLTTDEEIMRNLLTLQGVPKVYIRNTVPLTEVKTKIDSYEATPEYHYYLDSKGSVLVKETPWIVKDDAGVDSYSLLPAAPVVALIKQIHKILV